MFHWMDPRPKEDGQQKLDSGFFFKKRKEPHHLIQVRKLAPGSREQNVGELALPITDCSTWGTRSWASTRQSSRAGPVVKAMGKLSLMHERRKADLCPSSSARWWFGWQKKRCPPPSLLAGSRWESWPQGQENGRAGPTPPQQLWHSGEWSLHLT